jgi:cobalamin biosynthesis protein CbiG
MEYSIAPTGEGFPLPNAEDIEIENKRLRTLVDDQRRQGREIVVVMGVGFVGAVMAGVIADSIDTQEGRSGKFVIGM